jgi:hypothetical protein
MSGYLPPHLRAPAASPAGASPSASPRSDASPRGDAFPRGDAYARRDGGYGGGFGRSSSFGSEPGSGRSGASNEQFAREAAPAERRGGVPEVVPADWTPPAHVAGLSREQVENIRRRLNVVVEEQAGALTSPIESFDDMVRSAAPRAAACAQGLFPGSRRAVGCDLSPPALTPSPSCWTRA